MQRYSITVVVSSGQEQVRKEARKPLSFLRDLCFLTVKTKMKIFPSPNPTLLTMFHGLNLDWNVK